MKLYYICEVCEQEFDSIELEGADQDLEIKGFCTDCSVEMGFTDLSLTNSRFYYH